MNKRNSTRSTGAVLTRRDEMLQRFANDPDYYFQFEEMITMITGDTKKVDTAHHHIVSPPPDITQSRPLSPGISVETIRPPSLAEVQEAVNNLSLEEYEKCD